MSITIFWIAVIIDKVVACNDAAGKLLVGCSNSTIDDINGYAGTPTIVAKCAVVEWKGSLIQAI